MTDLPTYELHVHPAYYNPTNGAASGYNAGWLRHNSPTTTEATTGSGSPDGRSLLAPWSVLAGIKSATWWIGYEIWIDPSWNPSNPPQGAWGTGAVPNCHNSSKDEESIGWVWGNDGVSSFYNSYIGGHFNLQLENSSFPNKAFRYFSNVPKGQWHSVIHRLDLGRNDITTYKGFAVPVGRVRTWLNGSDTPVDTGPTNTVMYLTNPSTGHTILQGVMALWDGYYTKNTQQDNILRFTPCRVGRTLPEMLADVPVFKEAELDYIFNPSAPGPNLGPGFYNNYTPARTTATFLLPPSLGGTGEPPPPAEPPPTGSFFGQWSDAVRWNAAPLVGDPDPPPPPSVVEEHNGPWSDAVKFNAEAIVVGTGGVTTRRDIAPTRRTKRRR